MLLTAKTGLATRQRPTTLKSQDVFSNDLYSGNAGAMAVNNGIDLLTHGGLIWVKLRSSQGTQGHVLRDTVRGSGYMIRSNATAPQAYNDEYKFNAQSTGWRANSSNAEVNANGDPYSSWTFRKAPRFFDIVSYTGNGANTRTITHNLGVQAGLVLIKNLSAVSAWTVLHTSLSEMQYLVLNTNATANSNFAVNAGPLTDLTFNIGSDSTVNANGSAYIAYVFANDPSDYGFIKCGSYTGNGTNQVISLGWQPRFLLVKGSNSATNWFMLDTTRNWTNSTPDSDNYLVANLNENEASGTFGYSTIGGFVTDAANIGANGVNYVYMAIRTEMP